MRSAQSASSLVHRLRGTGNDRPTVDRTLAGGLRDWLEDGVAEVVALLSPDAPPVRVSASAITQVLACEAHQVVEASTERTMTPELALGSLVDAAFRQWATVGHLENPLTDAIAAMDAAGDASGTAAWLRAQPKATRQKLDEDLKSHAARISEDWTALSPAWYPRTQERFVAPIAGGRVVLSGVVDLALGAPPHERASVCIVEVKSDKRRIDHRHDLHYYSLLEALRSGASPFRVATYYSSTGELDVENISEELLIAALLRTLDATVLLCRVAAGIEPDGDPNPMCSKCTGLAGCASDFQYPIGSVSLGSDSRPLVSRASQ